MSGSLSDIFNGQPVPPQPTGSDASTQFPLWQQGFVYNLANAANNLAGSPYNPYPGPMVAAPSDQTVQAENLAGSNVGNWQPALNQAMGDVQTGQGYLGQGAGLVKDAQGLINQAPAFINSGQGLVNQGAGFVQNGQNLLNSAPSYINAGAGIIGQANNTLGAGKSMIDRGAGYLDQAGSPVTGSDINNFMNPYMDQVIGGLTSASNKNFFQNQLPGIQANFVSAGQSRSPQEMQATNNLLYQNNQALNNSIAGALGQGYQGALNATMQQQGLYQNAGQGFGALGSAIGNIGGTQGQLGSATGALGATMGQLGSASSTMGGTMGQLGATSGNLGATMGQLGSATGNLGSTMGQLGSASGGLGATSGQLGVATGQLGAQDVGTLAASGATQDINAQANINAGMNNFYAQQQWPYQNLGFASNILRGQQIPTNVQTVGTNYAPGQNYTSSPLASFVGTTLGSSALGLGRTGTATGAARGGHVASKKIGALAVHRAMNDNPRRKKAA